MTTTIPAVFDHGVFRPETPVALPEGTRVTLQVDVEDQEQRKRREALAEFVQFCRESKVNSGGLKLTRDELHERR